MASRRNKRRSSAAAALVKPVNNLSPPPELPDLAEQYPRQFEQQQPGQSTPCLYPPTDSNATTKTDDSDSELSHVENDQSDNVPSNGDTSPLAYSEPDIAMPDAKMDKSGPEIQKLEEQDEEDADIGEIEPDHWSGTVPVFKPTMHQFKDFKIFVCLSILSPLRGCPPYLAQLTTRNSPNRWNE